MTSKDCGSIDDCEFRRERISSDVISPGNSNLYGMPPPTMSEVLLDLYFQPGKIPDSLADYLRGMLFDRTVIKPKSP